MTINIFDGIPRADLISEDGIVVQTTASCYAFLRIWVDTWCSMYDIKKVQMVDQDGFPVEIYEEA